MTQIQDLLDKLRSEYQTESVIADLSKKGKFNRFSEDPKKTIQRLGNIELYELGEVSKMTQCAPCSKYWPAGLLYCTCGVCFMLSLEQKRKINCQFEILSIPYFIVITDYSWGARYGQSQWQYYHWKAKDTKRNAQKKNHDFILLRWQDDERYRNFPLAVGWTDVCWHIIYRDLEWALKIWE